MKTPTDATRAIAPKKWVMLGTVAATGLATAMNPAAPGPSDSGASSFLFSAAYAQEAGEAGEGAVDTENAEVAFLVHLGFFEATHRIVAALYAQGETQLAQEHLEASHHAYYEDIAEGLTTYGATGFEDRAAAFAQAVTAGAAQDEVAQRATAVFDAIAAVHADTNIAPADDFQAIHLLVETAAGDFQAGVETGKVVEPQEYRDAWGFAEVARMRARQLAEANDASVAGAAHEVLKRLEPVWPLFPALVSDVAGDDPAVLFSAAGWVEIAALRVK